MSDLRSTKGISTKEISAQEMSASYISVAQRDELECLEIRHPAFSADLLLQGAQLIHYAPSGENNWLWLSDLVEYKQGTSLRGGIPVCWPWFGNASMNPDAVKSHIADAEEAPAHGFARTRLWLLSDIYEDADEVVVTLTLNDTQHPQWQADLAVEAEFRFTSSSVSVVLATTNNGETAVSFSQALHTYFPTSDIHNTRITGFDGESYLDTLEGWQRKSQQGDIRFSGETDRIYFGEETLSLVTPQHITDLSCQGSQSAVVWNPWVKKSQRLSQFAADDYQRMFCVETANAADDAVTLAAGDEHVLCMLLTRR